MASRPNTSARSPDQIEDLNSSTIGESEAEPEEVETGSETQHDTTTLNHADPDVSCYHSYE